MPVMLRHRHFVLDILDDVLIFIRFKSYYEKARIYQDSLKDAPRPETWIREIDSPSPDLPVADGLEAQL